MEKQTNLDGKAVEPENEGIGREDVVFDEVSVAEVCSARIS